ncbi:M18 family aminopeptidase [Vallitalea okinawensis]|uniref:M18 family aminopeptidase n=1 Tax=Vallitalea okinawensis TaxID=2078660 RepID=UPI001FA87D72|nr:M18 family aminopeptidase [Vallitalea okinawensis]
MSVQNLLSFINESPNSYYAVLNMEKNLEMAGFTKLNLQDQWSLEKGGKYFIKLYDTSCIAFHISESIFDEFGFKVITAHTDSPSIKIKPNPDMSFKNYVKLNCEIYGGPILSTWLDRPLSLAGKVALKSKNPLKPNWELVNIKRPIMTIPNLAIHMNREVNKGVELNKQTDMLPIIGLLEDQLEKENYLAKLLAKEIGVDIESIMDFDLYLYPFEDGCKVGAEEEFISAGRLDDLAMVSAGLDALLQSQPKTGVNVLLALDNEEIGSRTKQGADSPAFRMILERICINLGLDRDAFLQTVFNSFMLSADMAHAIHPNRPEKHDPVNQPKMNQGPVIKYNANYKYPTDSTDTSVFESICVNLSIPVQKFVNKSDQLGGSTIGAVNAGQLPIRTVDLGMPMLAMHSTRELIGTKDYDYTVEAFTGFYNL